MPAETYPFLFISMEDARLVANPCTYTIWNPPDLLSRQKKIRKWKMCYFVTMHSKKDHEWRF